MGDFRFGMERVQKEPKSWGGCVASQHCIMEFCFCLFLISYGLLFWIAMIAMNREYVVVFA